MQHKKYLTRKNDSLTLSLKKSSESQLWYFLEKNDYLIIKSKNGRKNLSMNRKEQVKMEYDSEEWFSRLKVKKNSAAITFLIKSRYICSWDGINIVSSKHNSEFDDWVIEN